MIVEVIIKLVEHLFFGLECAVVAFIIVVLLASRNKHSSVIIARLSAVVSGKNRHVYSFKSDRSGKTVFISERLAQYFEIDILQIDTESFKAILQKATNNRLQPDINKTERTVFVTPVTGRETFVLYACRKSVSGGFCGFLWDLTPELPHGVFGFCRSDNNIAGGISNCNHIKASLADIVKNINTTMVFATIEISPHTSGTEVYDLEFEQSSYKLFSELIRKEFTDCGVFYIKNGEFLAAFPPENEEHKITDISTRMESILGVRYTLGEKSFSYACKIGYYLESTTNRVSEDRITEALNRLAFCKKKLNERYSGEMYVFSENDYDKYLSSRARTSRLPDIFREKAISLCFQPIVSVKTAKTEFYEVLMRISPELYPSTGMFIDDCISEGMDVELDNLVWQKLANGLEDGSIPANSYSVNMMGNTSIGESVERVAKSLSAKGCTLYIEFTEHINVSEAMQQERYLKATEIGAKLSADDYGIAHSNLELLFKTRFEIVKIPSQFVSGIDKNPPSIVFVKAIIDFAASIGVHCVAEGVETQEELAVLVSLGADYIQGYYFDKPLPVPPAEYKSYIIPRSDKDKDDIAAITKNGLERTFL